MGCAPTRTELHRLLKSTSTGRLTKSGPFTSFRSIDVNGRAIGPRLGGVSKRLTERIFTPHLIAAGAPRPRSAPSGFRGLQGGRRRGAAVDAQVGRLVEAGHTTDSLERVGAPRLLRLTRLVFGALAVHNLTPIISQRVVIDQRRSIGTAVDLICVRDRRLCLLELKCGFDGDRTAALAPGALLRPPLERCVDSPLHRHFAQLAATKEIFLKERGTLAALKSKGLEGVDGILLYVSELGSEIHVLPETYWKRRGARLLNAIQS